MTTVQGVIREGSVRQRASAWFSTYIKCKPISIKPSRSTMHNNDGCVRGEGVPRQVPCDRRCCERLAGTATCAATTRRRQRGGSSSQRFCFLWYKSRAGFRFSASSGQRNTTTCWRWQISTRRAGASGATRRSGASACYSPTQSPSPFSGSSAQSGGVAGGGRDH